MVMDAGMDTGAILEQAVEPISPEDTAGDVANRMAELGGGLLVSTLEKWMAGTIDAHAQNESEATLAPILKKEDGLLDWRQSATNLANRIRGLSPWPGGYTFANGERWGVWKVQVEETEDKGLHDIQPGSPQEPGTIIEISKQMIRVQTGKGVLHILEIQPANKKRMAVGDYLAGHRIEVGTLLHQPQASQETSFG
jgi:methionyl-tRNA formyltransferase